MSPDRSTTSRRLAPVVSSSAVARHPGSHSADRFSTVSCVASTVTHESPQLAFLIDTTFEVPAFAPSHAGGRTCTARNVVNVPRVRARLSTTTS